MNWKKLAIRSRGLFAIIRVNVVTAMVLLNGCTTRLVQDPVQPTPRNSVHCDGSEWSDDSSVAVIPVPFIAWFSPHVDLNELGADEFLRHCGRPSKLINREVDVLRLACIPTALTRIMSLGIWQWCPAHVSWQADEIP